MYAEEVFTWSSGGVRSLFDFWMLHFQPVWSPIDGGVYFMLPLARDSAMTANERQRSKADRNFNTDRLGVYVDLDDFGRWERRTVGGGAGGEPTGQIALRNTPQRERAHLFGQGVHFSSGVARDGRPGRQPRISQTMSAAALRLEQDPSLATARGAVCEQQSPGAAVSWLVASGAAGTSEWLSEVCYDTRGSRLRSRKSQPIHYEADEFVRCDITDCSGCATLRLQQLCFDAQACAVSQCVGTTVNQVPCPAPPPRCLLHMSRAPL